MCGCCLKFESDFMLTLCIIPHKWAISILTEDGNALLCCCLSGGAQVWHRWILYPGFGWKIRRSVLSLQPAQQESLAGQAVAAPGGSRESKVRLMWGLDELMEQLSCHAAPRSHLWPLPPGILFSGCGDGPSQSCSMQSIRCVLLPACPCQQPGAFRWPPSNGRFYLDGQVCMWLSACFSWREVII